MNNHPWQYLSPYIAYVATLTILFGFFSGPGNQFYAEPGPATGIISKDILLRPNVSLNAASMSFDARSVLVGSQDKMVGLWDIPTRILIRSFPQEDPVFAVAISPNGKVGLIGNGLAFERGQTQLW